MRIKLLSLIAATCITICSIAQGLKINPGATFKTHSGIGIIVQNGSFINNGNGDFSAGDLYMTGGKAGNIEGTSAITVSNLYINKPSSTAFLQLNLNVTNNVVFQNGLLDLNGYNLLLAPTGLLVGESETSRITGSAGGYVSITVNLDAPLGDNPGNLGALIASTHDLGSVVIQRGHNAQTKSGSGKSILRYFNIRPSNNSSLNAIFRFKYFDAELNGLSESSLNMWRSANGGTSWSALTTGDQNTALNFIDVDNVNVFARYTLSSATFSKGKLGKLNANGETDNVMLTWSTTEDFTGDKFIVEKSLDSTQWYAIGSVKAKTTGLSPVSNYDFYDNNPHGEKIYYRVQAIDNSNAIAFTNIAAVAIIPNIADVSLTPNPVHTNGTVEINALKASNSILRIFAADGRLVLQQQANLAKGNNQINIDASRLANGMYYLIVEMKDGTKKNIPFVKQ